MNCLIEAYFGTELLNETRFCQIMKIKKPHSIVKSEAYF